jgi:hypothetical protein
VQANSAELQGRDNRLFQMRRISQKYLLHGKNTVCLR